MPCNIFERIWYSEFILDDVFLLAKLDKAVLTLTKFEMKFFREKNVERLWPRCEGHRK